MGGWILTEDYEAKQGDILTYGPYNFRIKEMEDHHIRYIEIYKQAKVVSEVKEFRSYHKPKSFHDNNPRS